MLIFAWDGEKKPNLNQYIIKFPGAHGFAFRYDGRVKYVQGIQITAEEHVMWKLVADFRSAK